MLTESEIDFIRRLAANADQIPELRSMISRYGNDTFSQIATAKIRDGNVTGSKIGWSAGSTPPSAPMNGDLWLYNGAGSGVVWLFRYNSGGSNKWEFVGGSPVRTYIATDETITADGTWRDPTTAGPSYTVPRAGDYLVQGMANMYHTTVNGNTLAAGFSINNATPTVDGYGAVGSYDLVGTGAARHIALICEKFGLSANDVIKMRHYAVGGGSANVRARALYVTPISVN